MFKRRYFIPLGRWTNEEHRLFLKGLELHGKGWKKIASLIKSRTVVQIRTHAQKYFLKVSKAKDGSSGESCLDGKNQPGYRRVRSFPTICRLVLIV